MAGIYPALAGNRAVTSRTPADLVHVVLESGSAAATAGSPRPFGMLPFATELSDDEVVQLLSFVHASWGNPAQSALAVSRFGSVR